MAAKSLSLKLNGTIHQVQLGSRVTKRDLYGYSKTSVEKEGHPLAKGYLSADGQMYTRQELSSVRMDPEGSPVEEVITELDGEAAQLQASSFDQDTSIYPVPLTRLAGFNVTDVYPLEAVDLEEGLYETQFSYRKSYVPKEALILVTHGEAYLMTGVTKKTTFVGLNVAYDFFDAEDDTEAEDDLDFAMI